MGSGKYKGTWNKMIESKKGKDRNSRKTVTYKNGEIEQTPPPYTVPVMKTDAGLDNWEFGRRSAAARLAAPHHLAGAAGTRG